MASLLPSPPLPGDAPWMHRCLKLAGAACSSVSPNPLVGSVIVHRDIILGQGAHLSCGGPHAEVHAIQQWLERPLSPKPSTGAEDSPILYVSLEPCNHYGRTPPCTAAIISSGIRTVVFGSYDPHPLVSGAGISRLLEAGIRVRGPVLEQDAQWMNRRFETVCLRKRPYIILKWAMSADGFLDDGGPGPGPRISGPLASLITHQLRREQSAILIGARTLIRDNPDLRAWRLGKPHPRVLIASNGRPLIGPFLVYGRDPGPVVLHWPRDCPAEDVTKAWCDVLLEHGLNSLLVEGGRQTHHIFLQSGVWDEIHVFQNQGLNLNRGTTAPQTPFDMVLEHRLGGDMYRIYRQGQPIGRRPVPEQAATLP